MSKRVLSAGLLGALAMFVWTFIAHELLPLGEAGVRQIANEEPLLGAMQTTISAGNGLYLFPSMTANPAAHADKLAHSPSGFLVYRVPGATLVFPKLLGIEFLTELAESLIVVFLLSLTRLTGFGAKVGFVTLAGLAAAITTNVSYWNWYTFPAVYTAGSMVTELIAKLSGLPRLTIAEGSKRTLGERNS